MKLYTEEQVQVAMRLSLLSNATFEETLKSLTPIELPSDEEIESGMNQRLFLSDKNAHFNSGAKAGFKLGAKWMREQILGKEDKTFKQKSKWTEVDNMTRRLK